MSMRIAAGAAHVMAAMQAFRAVLAPTRSLAPGAEIMRTFGAPGESRIAPVHGRLCDLVTSVSRRRRGIRRS
ncbi:hypothetical protein [Rhodoplanes sp. SY1]|uniref:hypothetical protein n=1 Tax=Rhodoplanes sp. SY1 TaxID=3166646 RepID=UPI0038B5D8E1